MSLVSSPYADSANVLQLDSLDESYQVVAEALQQFQSVTEAYATEFYEDSFNLDNIVNAIRTLSAERGVPVVSSVYVIAFRSVLKPEIRTNARHMKTLLDFDRRSHAEANLLGGLLKYWYGTAHKTTGHNLATCWWRNAEDAVAGGQGPAHRQSVKQTASWYDFWKVEQYELQISSLLWRLGEWRRE